MSVRPPDPAEAPPDTGLVLDFTGGPPDGSKERPFSRRDSEALSLILTELFMDVRFNLRSQRIEWRGLGVLDVEDWTAVNRRVLANLRERIARQYFVRDKGEAKALHWGRDTFTDTLDALVRYREADPLLDWLERLPAWDGNPKLSWMLNCCFDVPEDDLSQWASRYLVLGVIQRTYEPGTKLDEIPVLCGPQGVGKSALLRAILPPDMPDLFGDALQWDAPEKVKVESTLGKAIVEVSEMAGHRRAEIEAIKAFITRQDDGAVRLAYATGTEPLPRRFILAATTNNESDLPNDPSGNRRFVPVPMTRNQVGSIEGFIGPAREKLWAEGMALYAAGWRANLPRELHAAQRERAEIHRDRDDVLEDAVAALYGAGPLTMATVIELLGEAARNATPHRVGRALKNAGWTQKRTKTQRLWVRKGGRMGRYVGGCHVPPRGG